MDSIRRMLLEDAERFLMKRILRLRDRRFVLFRWLRLKLLMRKYHRTLELMNP